jgi:serine/threonine protein kinase
MAIDKPMMNTSSAQTGSSVSVDAFKEQALVQTAVFILSLISPEQKSLVIRNVPNEFQQHTRFDSSTGNTYILGKVIANKRSKLSRVYTVQNRPDLVIKLTYEASHVPVLDNEWKIANELRGSANTENLVLPMDYGTGVKNWGQSKKSAYSFLVYPSWASEYWTVEEEYLSETKHTFLKDIFRFVSVKMRNPIQFQIEQLNKMLLILSVVEKIHRAGIIHADLNLRNIITHRREQEIKVADFGVAISVDDANEGSLENRGGTVGYKAPEQEHPSWYKLSPRTDIYALGLIIRFA